VRIGANAVVVTDIPDGVTAVGVPARVVKARGADDSNGSG
jgi:serine O-acetyltransferase